MKKSKIIMLLKEIQPPLFLSKIDMFQNLAVRLYGELHFMSNDLVTAEDMWNIAIPILESNITDEDIQAYQELRRDPVVCQLMGRCPPIKKALKEGRQSQIIHNYERKVINKKGVS